MTGNKNAWEKYGVIVGIIGLAIGSILSGIALIQSNYVNQKSIELAQASLALENITSNYQAKIIPYNVRALIDHEIHLNYINGTSDGIGFLNFSVIVATPHALLLNYTKSSSFVAQKVAHGIPTGNTLEWVNSSKSKVEYYPFMNGDVVNRQTFEVFVQPGITQVNFTIPLSVQFCLNSDWLCELNITDAKLVPENSLDKGFTSAGSAFISLGQFDSQIDIVDLQSMTHDYEQVTCPVEVATYIESFAPTFE
jgi:hypothetical protein